MCFAALLHDIYHKVERDLCLFGTDNHSQADYNEKGQARRREIQNLQFESKGAPRRIMAF